VDLKEVVWYASGGVCLICFSALSVSMAANDAMTTTRIRKYDLERLKGLALARESNWEVIQRLIDEYMARRT